MPVWIVLVLHLIASVLIWLLIRAGRLRVNRAMMPVVACVPIFGAVCAVLIHLIVKTGKDGRSSVYQERKKIVSIEPEAVRLRAEDQKLVVPLEEALLLNENSVRRILMMDILTGKPDEYLSVLYQARLNEDTEVVHYAVTAVTELTKQYDLRLQRIEAEYAENPDNREVLDTYLHFLEEYIEKEIAQGQYLLIQRNQLDRLLKKWLSQNPDMHRFQLMVHNEIELKLFSGAGAALEQMEQIWPEAEQTWLLKLKYYAVQGEGRHVQELIRRIDEKHIYMSVEGKKVLDFWRQKTGDGE